MPTKRATIRYTPNPVTIWYNGHTVAPIRQVLYTPVKAITGINPALIGKVQFRKRTIFVARNIRADGTYTAWESILNVNIITL
jgi:hypothetical protein